MKATLLEAVRAAQDHKAADVAVLEVGGVCSFTDYFLICSGHSTRHTRSIADAILERLKRTSGLTPAHLEGYAGAEWILMDYLNFVVHIFSEGARDFYDLERLWKTAPRVAVPKG